MPDDLTALGMGIAFDATRADLSRIANVTPERLYLSRVDQKTFVEVNEEDTEAAAIRERLSGTVLFLGLMNVIGE